MKTVAFFSDRGGVGKTSLVYHVAWMFADLGLNIVAADLDPQASLTSMFLDEERLEELWPEAGPRRSIYGAVQPLLEGIGDIADPHTEEITPGLRLVVGDLLLSMAEEKLSGQWHECLAGKPRAFRVLSALWRVLRRAAEQVGADVVLVDVGPDLSALNRAALVAADHVVVPLAPDLYSLQGLDNLGPTLRRWREEWRERRQRNPATDLPVPEGAMRLAGYVVVQHSLRLDRPVTGQARWLDRIPASYLSSVLAEDPHAAPSIERDPHCLATLKRFRSLMPLAVEARKPMFALKPADGAIGGQAQAVQDCYRDFRALAARVAERCGIALP